MGVWVSRLCLGLGRLRVQKQPGHRAGDTEGCRGRRGRALRGHIWVQLGVGKPGRLLWTLGSGARWPQRVRQPCLGQGVGVISQGPPAWGWGSMDDMGQAQPRALSLPTFTDTLTPSPTLTRSKHSLSHQGTPPWALFSRPPSRCTD